jgi:LysM repeat protein
LLIGFIFNKTLKRKEKPMQKSLYTIQSQRSSKQVPKNQDNSWGNEIKNDYKAFFNTTSLRLAIMFVVLILSSSIFVFGGCIRETSKGDLDQVKGRLEKLENKITQLEAQFTETNESLTTLSSYVISLEERIKKITKEIEEPSLSKQTVSQENKQYYKVVRGDTLYSISKKYGLSVDELRRLNNLNENKPIQPGQRLMVTTESHK